MVESLLKSCYLCTLTEKVLCECEPFSCGDADMDEFFRVDAIRYARYRMGKSYCFRQNDNPKKIVACFTVSNDSIRLFDLGSSKKNRMWKEISNREKRLSRYPGVLIGRLAVSAEETGKGIGSDVIRFVKEWFVVEDNKSGCRLAIVDAKNTTGVLAFYQKNRFKFLFKTEADEQAYMNNSHKKSTEEAAPPLSTRLMYCDLLADNDTEHSQTT